MLPKRFNVVPKWNGLYVAAPIPRRSPKIREMLASMGGGARPQMLRGLIEAVLKRPMRLDHTAMMLSKVMKVDEQTAKGLVVEMVRAEWIQERISVPEFAEPVFIIAAPRSGSNLLFEQLCKVPGLWHIGGESHSIFDGVLGHGFDNPEFKSIRAEDGDATPDRTRIIRDLFARRMMRAEDRVRYMDIPEAERPETVRILDKLPKNTFRVSFLNASFPTAKFIYLWREPKGNVSSMIDAWREGQNSGRFVTYKELPGTKFKNWCLVLPPGWQEVIDRGEEEIAAYQWASANSAALDDLARVPHERWCSVSYADLLAEPRRVFERLSAFMGLEWKDSEEEIGKPLAMSRTTLTPPSEEKWKKNAVLIDRIMPTVEPVYERISQAISVVP